MGLEVRGGSRGTGAERGELLDDGHVIGRHADHSMEGHEEREHDESAQEFVEHGGDDVRAEHGGGEVNVAEGMAYVFRLRTTVLTALVDDGFGRNIECQFREAGVDTSRIIWFKAGGKEGKYVTDSVMP